MLFIISLVAAWLTELLITPALILHSIIISFVAAWLARALLSFKCTQSSVIRDESAPRGYSELQD